MAAPAESMTEENSDDVPLEKTYTVEGKYVFIHTKFRYVDFTVEYRGVRQSLQNGG